MAKENDEKKEGKDRSVQDKLRDAVATKINRTIDFMAEYGGTDSHGPNRNYTDLDDAVQNAKDYVSPDDTSRASDGVEEGRSKRSLFKRDLQANSEQAKKRRAEGKKILSDADREAKIDRYIQNFEKEMDKRGCDGLQFVGNGYDIRLIRVPDEDSPIQININGKPVYVHPELKGDEVFVRESQAEISRELLEKLNSEMIGKGIMRAEKNLADGHSVSCSADVRVNGKKAIIDTGLGDNECVEESGGWKISRELWDEAYSGIEENGRSMWAKTKEGNVIECGIEARVNGKPAILDENLQKGTVIATGLAASVSKDDWDRAYKEMMANGTSMYGKTMPDGNVITCQLKIRVNGERAEIDHNLAGISLVKKEPCFKIGKGIWEKAKTELVDSPNPSRAVSRIYDEQGHKIECRMDLKIDGKEAVINKPFGAGTVKEGRSGIEISKDIFDNAKVKMDNEKKTIHTEKLDDGREIRFKRKAKGPNKGIKMYTKDGEIRDTDFRDCVAGIGGLDESSKRRFAGDMYMSSMKQLKIQSVRSTVINAGEWATMKRPNAIRNEQRSIISHILGMAMNQMGRGIAI